MTTADLAAHLLDYRKCGCGGDMLVVDMHTIESDGTSVINMICAQCEETVESTFELL